MGDDTKNIFVYLKELPSEISAGFIIFIILLCLCCFKDCFCSMWVDRRATQRLRRLQRIQQETQEIEVIRSLERRNPPPSSRGVQV